MCSPRLCYVHHWAARLVCGVSGGHRGASDDGSIALSITAFPNWRRGIPAHVGVPTKRKPDRCSACRTPIWCWDGTNFVCYNCKVYDIVHDRKDGELGTLEGCFASGVYR